MRGMPLQQPSYMIKFFMIGKGEVIDDSPFPLVIHDSISADDGL